MRDLTSEQMKGISRAVASDAPFYEGVIVPRFNKMELARAIEGQIKVIEGLPNQKVTIHMDAHDAAEFARALRKLALLET